MLGVGHLPVRTFSRIFPRGLWPANAKRTFPHQSSGHFPFYRTNARRVISAPVVDRSLRTVSPPKNLTQRSQRQ